MGLLPESNTDIKKDGGSAILFNGENLLDYTEKQMTQIRGCKISMIFQDPITPLNRNHADWRTDYGEYFNPS